MSSRFSVQRKKCGKEKQKEEKKNFSHLHLGNWASSGEDDTRKKAKRERAMIVHCNSWHARRDMRATRRKHWNSVKFLCVLETVFFSRLLSVLSSPLSDCVYAVSHPEKHIANSLVASYVTEKRRAGADILAMAYISLCCMLTDILGLRKGFQVCSFFFRAAQINEEVGHLKIKVKKFLFPTW